MKYKYLGKTNLKLSTIGIGAGVLNPNKDSLLTLEKAQEVISLATSYGVNFIDMGKEYNEFFLSQAMSKNKGKLHIITRSEARNADEMKNDIKDSLKKLNVNYIDVYEIFVNSEEEFKKMVKEGVIEVLKQAKSAKLIKFIGIFSHRIDILEKAIKTNEFDVVMTLYNAVHRLAEKLFPLKKRYGFGFIAAAPFATGILGKGIITAEDALKFVLSSRYVDALVVGMKEPSHIKENLEIAGKEWKLSKTERNEISKKIEIALGQNFCRMCRYCQCPKGIPITDVLKLNLLATRFNRFESAKWQYSMQRVKADTCDECKLCERECPYNLPIIKLLKDTHKILSRN
jgi:predicted aldo/keto reductase-like oxidoreductase